MKYEDLNFEHISKDKEVLDLIKQKLTIEQKINELDEFALRGGGFSTRVLFSFVFVFFVAITLSSR